MTIPARSARPAPHLTRDGSESLARLVHPSPLGPLTIVAGPDGVRAVLWPDDDPQRVTIPDDTASDREVEIDPAASGLARRAAEQLDAYFSGERTSFDLPLDPHGTPFQLAAWEVLRTIPYGSTMTYGEQAAALGDRRKARAVGAANGRNPLSIIVPCHRVHGSDGRLTGFAGGLDAKAWLLDHERHVVAAAGVAR